MTEPALLTLFFAIACAAWIGAVNARGTIRLIISCALACVCSGLALYHTYRYEARQTAAMDMLTSPSAGAPDQTPPADSGAMAAAEANAANNPAQNQGQGQDQGLDQSQNQAQGQTPGQDQAQNGNQAPNPSSDQNSANSDLRKIAHDARRLQGNLAAINLATVSQISDAEYAHIQSSARQYTTEAQALQTRMATLAASPPVGQEDVLQSLTSAIGYLVSASQDLERFFNSESTADEKMHAAGFRDGTRAAGASLAKVESHLNGAETSAP